MATHEVLNQPPPLVDYDLFHSDRALADAVRREGAAWAEAELSAFGTSLGRAETIEWGVEANRNPPELHAFDRYGNRQDKVEFHPAWHQLMTLGVAAGLHASPWSTPQPGAHVARAAGALMLVQIESGVQCPITMTYGAVATLRRHAEISAEWLPRIFSRSYDRSFRPVAEKSGALIGMAMTEKQGGSDLRANTTRAEPSADGTYRLTGHKWFMSAPMCDAFLTLAQAPGGLTCFFLPRWTPGGALNAIRLQRLKDKLGNRSNASSEIELDCAWARRVGEEGRGIPTIIEMGNYTRLDCALGSAGLMRQAVAQAIHHAEHRTTFQKKLADQALMTNVLADMALESEAATALALRLARAYDNEDDPAETAFRRVVTPAAKYWICKRGPMLTAEAMEVLGGNGYVEECPMPRLYREAPVNSIWEGSGNIMCLDVLRALGRSGAVEAVLAELRDTSGGNADLDRYVAKLEGGLAGSGSGESVARRLVEATALALQAALLLRHAPNFIADAFCASRLGGDWGHAFGTLPSGTDLRAIVARASPL
jgi:putative acyl-CoA dehydrogenase